MDGREPPLRVAIGRHVVLPMVAKRIRNISIIEESLPQGWGFGGLVGAEVTPDEVATVCADLARQRVLRLRVCPNSLQGSAWIDGIANNLRGAVTMMKVRATRDSVASP